ncbi:hypothetical protein BA185_09220, partial [Helicobacter pullorum]
NIPNLVLDFFIKSIEFELCNFKNGLTIRDDFRGSISIKNNIFLGDFNILWIKNEMSKVDIRKNIFKNVLICENQILSFHFEENSIQNINISKNLFSKEARFNNNSFNNECIFFSNLFENLSFYGSKFEESFIFFQNTIKGTLNAVNTNLNFTFDDLQEKIIQRYKEFNKNKKEQHQKSLDKFANDFRDSFRIFKNALIKDNNLLDASNFHKYELYSKEIELDSKETKTIKDKVEKWQLWFYRNLCDHHTDLVLNLKWLVYTIALYVLLLGKISFVYPVAIFVFCAYVYMRGFKNVWLVVSSAIVFITILDTPKIILGISNLFEKDLNLWQNFITTLYVIAIGLVLFSLQKTARKNSIVPN